MKERTPMAKADTRQSSRRKNQPEQLPFTRANYGILGAGLLLIALGYVALSQKPWDGFFPLVVAPILLVAGYVFVIPYGILHREKVRENSVASESESANPKSQA